MGFINYHGEKESHYSDILEYADLREKMDRQKRDEQKKAAWFATFSREPKYAGLDANTLLKLAVKAYRDTADGIRKLQLLYRADDVDAMQLWQDLWLYTTENCLISMELPEEKIRQILPVLSEKVLHLEGKTSAEKHLSEKRNRRYQRYLEACFRMQESHMPAYWYWLSSFSKNGGEAIPDIIAAYERYSMYLRYYLYKSTHTTSESWMRQQEQERTVLHSLSEQVRKKEAETPLASTLRNPLYRESLVQQMILFTQIVLFRYETLSRNEDPYMIEDLYEYLQEHIPETTAITSILPESAGQEINAGKLPVFADASVSGLQPGEQIHYVNHAIIYQPADSGDTAFQSVRGMLAITDKRIVFRSAGVKDIWLEELFRVTEYDMNPGFLEFQGESHTVYVSLPDLHTAYRVLQLIASTPKEKKPQSGTRIPFSYQELVERADLSACIFAFECLGSYPFPEELHRKVELLLRKLHGLQTAVRNHPDRADEIARFLNYYLPEAVHLMVSYDEYQQAELEKNILQKTYILITESIDTLDAAVEQKIFSIYSMEAMETRAKADALKKILEQDGYYREEQLLKH